MRNDRLSALEQSALTLDDALSNEFTHGLNSLAHAQQGAAMFAAGAGRGGSFAGFDGGEAPAADSGRKGVVFDVGGVIFDSPINHIIDYEKELGLVRCDACGLVRLHALSVTPFRHFFTAVHVFEQAHCRSWRARRFPASGTRRAGRRQLRRAV